MSYKKNFITNEDILMEPENKLREISQEVSLPLSKNDTKILRTMYNHVSNSQDSNYAHEYNIRPAVGIAAIQIGVLKRMIAVKFEDEYGNSHKYMLVNPQYKYKSDEICFLSHGEGCLSVEEDKYHGIIPRSYEIEVEAYNLFDQKVINLHLQGYSAIVVQHEMDHLDGILYFDHINKLDPNYKNDSWIEI